MTIRLLLADDQALVRGALAALLDLESDLEVVAEVGRGDQVVAAALEHAANAHIERLARTHLHQLTPKGTNA